MTPEEKAVAMQFMGQTYGEAHKQDQMIIGNAGNLKPQSPVLKEQFENVARLPTVAPQQQLNRPPQQQPGPQPEAPAGPVVIQQVTPEQAAQEIAATSPAPLPVATSSEHPEIFDDCNQMEFDLSEPSKTDKLISLAEEQILLLKQISLKLGNGKTAKGNKQR
tara:strand:+ start:163 stop:651 length:489 start_codon:yes stop_codon:yes gene_type:complete